MSHELDELIFDEDAVLEDGIYDVTDIERAYFPNVTPDYISEKDFADMKAFIDKHGDDKNGVFFGAPYETIGVFLFAKKPKKISLENVTGGAGHGANVLVTDCPRELLILAEND